MKKYLLIPGFLFLVICAGLTQDFEVSFNGGESVIDSVIATNLSTGDHVKLPGDGILVLRDLETGINPVPSIEDKISIMYALDGKTTMNFLSSEQQNIMIRLCDISGKILVQKDFRTLEGINQYIITTDENGIYLINILTPANCYSVKGILHGMGSSDIKYSGLVDMNTHNKSKKSTHSDSFVLLFSPGDIIAYEFHSGESTTLIHEEAGASAILHPEFHNCVDYDGNSYSVVQIGSQWWMAENLQSTRYADGTEVVLMEDSDLWSLFIPTMEAICYYNNDESLGYGGLYTYTAAVHGTPYVGIVESQGICPDGWHLPSDDDWMELKNYLIDNGFNWDGTTTENKIGKSLASSSEWVPNTIVEGSAGYDQESNNRTGFNAKPYGLRDELKGIFTDYGYAGFWWSSTEKSDSYAYSWNIVNELGSLNHIKNSKTRGYSVRCMKTQSEVQYANFSADRTEVSVGEEVRFTDHSSDEPDIWFWDFGDLSYSTEQNPVHIYTSPGIYTVHVSFLIDRLNRYETKTDYIHVSESNKRTIEDTEGNIYKSVKIGNQLWMAENLKSTRYDSENEIPLVTGNSEWGSLAADNSARAYCFYNNDVNSRYGALYTYAAAVNGTPYDGTGHVQGICPDGWHIPAETEWDELENYLVDNGYNYDGSTTGNKIAKSLASTTGWTPSTEPGAAGLSQDSNNRSGFNGFPGGYRSYYSSTGEFDNAGDGGYWWMSNELFDETAMFWNIYYNYKHVLRDYTFKRTGMSVRCLKNDDGSPLADFTSDVREVKLGIRVNFTDLSHNSPTRWTWDFNSPGELSTEQNPSHTFTREGLQRVTLIAANDVGYDVESKTGWINVTQRTSVVNDIEGNLYPTVEIGNQWWMAENLKTTKLRNGTDIPEVTDKAAWGESSSPAYCWYECDRAAYEDTYGALYNWYTVNTGNLCPAGWHVATENDWKELEMALGMSPGLTDSTNLRGNLEGSKLAGKADLWGEHMGMEESKIESNVHFGTSGFSALPGGSLWDVLPAVFSFLPEGKNAHWWSSTEFNSDRAWSRYLLDGATAPGKMAKNKKCGFYVRCVRD